MNKVVLVGRIAKEPELKRTQNDTAVCSFTVACQRKFKNADGKYDADFLNCVAWRQTAEFIQKYFIKGSPIALEGTIQNRSYQAQDGTKKYITEIVVDAVEFCGAANSKPNSEAKTENWQQVEDDELPF